MTSKKDMESTAIKCAYADLIGAYQAMQQGDINAHDWKAHYLSICELEQTFGFIEPVKLGVEK